MTMVRDMLEASPSPIGFDGDDLAACIQACIECAQACTACADACLGEDMVGHLLSLHHDRSELRRHLRGHGPGALPPDCLRPRDDASCAPGVSGRLPHLRRGVRAARVHA